MSRRSSNNAFVRFINLVRAISVLPAGVTLDPLEERLLQELGLRWHLDQRVTVLEAMQILPESSPSTLQRRLKTLRAKGLLDFQADPADARVRHVVPTPAGRAYFHRLGQLMKRAAGQA